MKTNLLNAKHSQLRTRFDSDRGALWTMFDQEAVPCFTHELLSSVSDHHQAILSSQGKVLVDGELQDIRYSILASITPGVFNLGGQLSLFSQLIKKRDRDLLMRYAVACIDVIHQRAQHFGLPLATITLLQGNAMGGGLEAALTSDIIIAERGVKMGFPEILFNLFPGMGAYSLVARKVNPKFAERMILGGEMFRAEELHEVGLVDVLADEGKGIEAVNDYIKAQGRRSNGFLAVQQASQIFSPVTYRELIEITTVWVDAALKLNERDLKVMDRLVHSQEKLFLHPQPLAA